jgi:hypothetical protein
VTKPFLGTSFVLENVNPRPIVQPSFRCFEYQGCELLRNPERTLIHRHDALKEGDKVLVPGLFGDFFPCEVKKWPDGELYADSDIVFAGLRFGGDDRECWISETLCCKKGLERVKFE